MPTAIGAESQRNWAEVGEWSPSQCTDCAARLWDTSALARAVAPQRGPSRPADANPASQRRSALPGAGGRLSGRLEDYPSWAGHWTSGAAVSMGPWSHPEGGGAVAGLRIRARSMALQRSALLAAWNLALWRPVRLQRDRRRQPACSKASRHIGVFRRQISSPSWRPRRRGCRAPRPPRASPATASMAEWWSGRGAGSDPRVFRPRSGVFLGILGSIVGSTSSRGGREDGVLQVPAIAAGTGAAS